MNTELDLKNFFSRARMEADRYGTDDWVFLRELVQNSRDARASAIHFVTNQSESIETLTCLDDGTGMSRQEIQSFFLRLYASSKETETDLLGFFGVGFWSVLRFEPETIEVTSMKNGESVSLLINPAACTLEEHLSDPPSKLTRNGTVITLTRKTRHEDLEMKLQERLLNYARYIQPAPGVSQLALTLNEKHLNKDLSNETEPHRYLNGPDYQCLIAMGNRPSFTLYQRGLLINECSHINELFPRRTSMPLAFSPQIKLNVDRITLLMDRRSVFEDRHLLHILEQVENACQHMHEQLIHESFPIDFRNQLHRFREKVFRLWPASPWTVFPALGLITICVILMLSIISPNEPIRPEPSVTRSEAPLELTSIRVSGGFSTGHDSQPTSWKFSYSSNEHLLFPLGSFAFTGNFQTTEPAASNPITSHLQGQSEQLVIKVEIPVKPRDGLFQVPIPLGYRLKSGSVFLEEAIEPVGTTSTGEPVINIGKEGHLIYEIEPGTTLLAPALNMETRLTRLLPEPVNTFIIKNRNQTTARKLTQMASFFRSYFTYSDTQTLSEKATHGKTENWIQTLLATGNGDCDLLNGLGTLILREWDIHARLLYGLVCENGTAHPGLHAWILYYDEGWQIFDLTTIVPAQQFHIDMGAEISTQRPSETHRSYPAGARSSPSPKINSVGKKPKSAAILLILAGSLLIIFILVIIFFKRKRATGRVGSVPPSHLADMFKHQLEKLSQDPMLLQFRPLFKTQNAGFLSFNQIYTKGSNSVAIGVPGPDRTKPGVEYGEVGNIDLLDPVDPYVKALRPFLPPLFDCGLILENEIPFPKLVSFMKEIRPQARLYIVEGTEGFHTYKLPFSANTFGHEQIVVGIRSLPLRIRHRSASRREQYQFVCKLLDLDRQSNL